MANKSLTLALFIFSFLGVAAQQNTDAAGGEAKGSGGTASYSIGQVDYVTNTGSSGSALQGVQQPYEIYTVSANEIETDLNISAYPNPSTDELILTFENYKLQTTFYQLIDLEGRLIDSKQLEDKQTTIDVKHLASATYYLKISTDGKELKVFKIIKL